MTGLVVDTSALVAVLQRAPGHEWLAGELAGATARLLAAPTALELSIVAESRAPTAAGIGWRMLRDAGIEVAAFDEDLAARAVDAWRRYGKGRHPAQLNFGECCTYALAERTGHPILCVGDDFARADLPVRRPPT